MVSRVVRRRKFRSGVHIYVLKTSIFLFYPPPPPLFSLVRVCSSRDSIPVMEFEVPVWGSVSSISPYVSLLVILDPSVGSHGGFPGEAIISLSLSLSWIKNSRYVFFSAAAFCCRLRLCFSVSPPRLKSFSRL